MNAAIRRTGSHGRLATALAMLAVLQQAGDGTAQVLIHPTRLDLPQAGDIRPDPDRLRVSLPNGLAAYVVPDAKVPLVTISAFVGVGWADGEPGAAHALAAILRSRGAAGMEADLAVALRRMAADFRVVLGAEELEITLDVPTVDAPEAIALVARMLRSPAIDGTDVSTLALHSAGPPASATARGESGPVLYEGSLEAAVNVFDSRLLEGHPYSPRITAEAAAALTARHVRELHERFFRGGNIVLAVSGDIVRDEATRLLREAFAAFPGGRAPSRPRVQTLDPPEARVAHVHSVDKLQGWVVLGHALDPVSRADEAALLVMNYILGGGHFDARLFIEVRDKRGLANTAGGFPEWRRRGPGSYTLRTYGRPETIPLLIRILQAEAERIRSEPVSAEALRVAKGALRDGEFAMGFHDGASTARTFARERLHDGDHRASATFRERIDAVTTEDVRMAALRFLHPDRMRMVVIGPLDRIRQHSPIEGEPPMDAFGRIIEVRQ